MRCGKHRAMRRLKCCTAVILGRVQSVCCWNQEKIRDLARAKNVFVLRRERTRLYGQRAFFSSERAAKQQQIVDNSFRVARDVQGNKRMTKHTSWKLEQRFYGCARRPQPPESMVGRTGFFGQRAVWQAACSSRGSQRQDLPIESTGRFSLKFDPAS